MCPSMQWQYPETYVMTWRVDCTQIADKVFSRLTRALQFRPPVGRLVWKAPMLLSAVIFQFDGLDIVSLQGTTSTGIWGLKDSAMLESVSAAGSGMYLNQLTTSCLPE